MKKNRAFTLIELIIAITIFSIISVSIYSVFRSGVRLWYRVSPMIQDSQSLRFFFNTISGDLENSLSYAKKGPNFEGSRRKMSFMTLIEVSDQGLSPHTELAKVIYYFDNTKKAITRGVATRSEGFSEDHAKFSDVLNNIDDKDTGFEYCYKLGSSKTEYDYEWKDEWSDKDRDNGKIPRAVSVRTGGYSKIIFIPTGTLGADDVF